MPIAILGKILVASGLTASAMASGYAQGYPARPVHLVVPHQVGVASDLVARGIGQMLAMGQPFVVENRVAANGIVGLEYLARAAADGYTLGVTNMGAIFINPAIYTKLSFDPLKDFAPVANIGAQDAA